MLLPCSLVLYEQTEAIVHQRGDPGSLRQFGRQMRFVWRRVRLMRSAATETSKRDKVLEQSSVRDLRDSCAH